MMSALVVANAAANFNAVRLGQLWSLILLTSALLPKSLYPTRAFRPDFQPRKQGYKSAAISHIAAGIINDPPDTLFSTAPRLRPDQIAIALNDPQPED